MANSINLTAFRFVVSLLQKSFADVKEEDMRLRPTPAMNPPVWILGHIVATFGFVPKMLGGELACPPEYLKWFGPGSKLEDLPAQLPSKKELLGKLSEAAERVLVAVPRVGDEDWAKPNPIPFFPTELPTLRDITENLLCNHTMLHVGQMTVWRRTQGLPAIIVVPTAS
jgi:uncharacterized damage-inducible protein DinB